MQIDTTKDDFDVFTTEIGNTLVSFDDKKDVISKLNLVITKDQKTGKLDIQYSLRNDMKILSKDDKILKQLQLMVDELNLLCGYETPKIDMNNIKIQ